MNEHSKPPYRKIALWTTLPIIALFAAAVALLLLYEPQAVYADTKDNSSVYYISNADTSQESAASMPINSKNVKKYTVRIQNNKISVFENGSHIPLCSIETPPTHLPHTDRILLEAGIETETYEEACRLIEDYE